LFDTILAEAGLEVALGGIQMPRMNSITERWIQSCRHELLDRTLVWNQAHLLHALREYGRHYNAHRPSLGSAGLLRDVALGARPKASATHLLGVVLVKAAFQSANPVRPALLRNTCCTTAGC